MSDDEISIMSMSYNIWDGISSAEASINNPLLEANIAEDEDAQEVTQTIGNKNIENEPEAGDKHRPNPEKVIPPEAQRYIGLIICKECSGIKYLGTVVDYDVDKKWFRVEYGDEGFEDMQEKSVRKLLANKDQINEAAKTLRKNNHSGGSKKNSGGKKKKKKKKKGASGEGSNKRKKSSMRNAEGPYIPLAYRETRKDAYYWY